MISSLPQPPAPPPINAGELALATVGVSALITGDIPKMGIGRIDEALAIPRKAEKLARRMCDGDLEYTAMPRPHDYEKIRERFARKLQQHDTQALVDAFPPEASAMSGPFQLVAQAAFEHVAALFPTSSITTFTGPRPLPPEDVRIWKFFSQLELLNDPLRAFELMASAALLRSQVVAVRAIYPTLTANFDATIYDQIAKHVGDKKSYQLPPRVEAGVAIWFGRRVVQYQPPKPPGAPGPGDSPPPGPPAPLPPPSATAHELATRTQKADGP